MIYSQRILTNQERKGGLMKERDYQRGANIVSLSQNMGVRWPTACLTCVDFFE